MLNNDVGRLLVYNVHLLSAFTFTIIIVVVVKLGVHVLQRIRQVRTNRVVRKLLLLRLLLLRLFLHFLLCLHGFLINGGLLLLDLNHFHCNTFNFFGVQRNCGFQQKQTFLLIVSVYPKIIQIKLVKRGFEPNELLNGDAR